MGGGGPQGLGTLGNSPYGLSGLGKQKFCDLKQPPTSLFENERFLPGTEKSLGIKRVKCNSPDYLAESPQPVLDGYDDLYDDLPMDLAEPRAQIEDSDYDSMFGESQSSGTSCHSADNVSQPCLSTNLVSDEILKSEINPNDLSSKEL